MSTEVTSISNSGPSESGQITSTGSTSGSPDGATGAAPIKISSLEDLKEKARPVYDAVMMSMAYEIKGQQDRSNDRIKEALREAQSR